MQALQFSHRLQLHNKAKGDVREKGGRQRDTKQVTLSEVSEWKVIGLTNKKDVGFKNGACLI